MTTSLPRSPRPDATPARVAGPPAAGLPEGTGVPGPGPRRSARTAVALTALVVWLVAAATWHLTQGTADVTVGELWRALTGQGGLDQAAAVVTSSRLPRLAAGVLVGCALGASGAALQGIARNPLAAPDTLAVNAGAHLAVTAAAVLGASLGALPGVVVAFAGGLAAAGIVIGLSGGAAASPIRLVLGGTAITLDRKSVV